MASNSGASRRRGFLSIGIYKQGTSHRIEGGSAVTLFVDLLRTQLPQKQAAEVRTAEGYCHYTGVMPGERGFRPDFVESGTRRE